MPGANDVVNLNEGNLTDGLTAALAVSGASGGVTFASPHIHGSSLTVDTTAVAGTDTVNVNGVSSSDTITALTIQEGTQAGDVLNVNGPVTVGGLTTLDAKTINLNADVTNAVTGSTATSVTVNITAPYLADPAQIQDGINVSAGGATVTVGAGTYNENLTIDRALTLLGPNVGNSGAGSRVVEAEVNGNVSLTTGGSVAIDGFTINGAVSDPTAPLDLADNIINSSGDAVTISGAPSATIDNNQITSTGGNAIYGIGIAGNVNISGNTLLAQQSGVDLASVGGSAVVQGNAIIANGDGIKLASVLGTVQLGGLVSGQENTIIAGNSGIVLLAGGVMGPVTAQNNTIFANDSGIDFENGASDFTATGNELVAGAGAGILVNGATSGNITLGGATLGACGG